MIYTIIESETGGKIMKKLLLLFVLMVLALFFIPVSALAEGEQSPLTQSEVEFLINQKLSEETPLTKEQLQEEVNRLKDEKIANLEGNIGTVIDSIGIFIGVASLILVGLTAIVGLIFNTIISKKLTKIEELDNVISTTFTNIETKHRQVEEFYKQVKEFSEELDKVKKQLSKNETLLEKREQEIEDLRRYVGNIEDITNSTIAINKFLKEKHKSLDIIEETRLVLQQSQKNPDFVITKLSQKLGMHATLTNQDEIINYLEVRVKDLYREEDSLWNQIERFKTVEDLYIEQDDNSTTLFDEVESNIKDWHGVLDDIILMKNHWEANLKLNPSNKAS
jgi:hypothetical protein